MKNSFEIAKMEWQIECKLRDQFANSLRAQQKRVKKYKEKVYEECVKSYGKHQSNYGGIAEHCIRCGKFLSI